MTKPNLLFPTPVWTIQLENHKNINDIVFYDPRPAPVYSHPNVVNPNLLNAQVNGISPKEGALVLFPSYLEHSVNENKSNEERIVISFNIRIQIK